MLLVFLTLGAGAALGLRSIIWAACVWLWNDIFRPVEWGRGYGFLSAGWFKPVHFCTALIIFAVFFTRWPRRWNLGAGAVAFLVIWVWISYLFAQLPDIAWEQAVMTSKYMIPLIPISMALCYRRAQQIFLYALAASVGIWLIHHGILTVLQGRPQIDMAIPGGQMTDRNDFLVAGNACLPLLLYMGWHYRGHFQRLVRLGTRLGAVFSVGAVFYSLSRGALVGLAILGLWWAAATGRAARKLATVAVLVMIALPFVPTATWERLSTLQLEGPQTEASAANRAVHMETAVEVTFDYPVFGVGPDSFPDVSLNYGEFNAEPHSLWLKASSEYGLPMFFFFLFLVIKLLRRLYRTGAEARAQGDGETEAMATALSCALVGFLGTGSFTSQFLSQYLWALIALSGAFLMKPYWMTAEEAIAATTPRRISRVAASRQIESASGA